MGNREAERALRQADNDQPLLISVTLGQLKTMLSDAVVRQARMRKVASDEAEAQNWEIHDAAVKAADKSYQVGVYVNSLLMSLGPDRIEDEWFLEQGTSNRLRRWKDFGTVEAEDGVSEGAGLARSAEL